MGVSGKLTDHTEEQCLKSIVLRVVSGISPLVKYLKNLREFAITFGLHLEKLTPVAFTLDRAITRIQEYIMTLTCHFS